MFKFIQFYKRIEIWNKFINNNQFNYKMLRKYFSKSSKTSNYFLMIFSKGNEKKKKLEWKQNKKKIES